MEHQPGDGSMNHGEVDASAVRYVYWEDNGMWLGYLEEFPDYWTQGTNLEDLQDHLNDIYKDLTSGEIPSVRRIAHLQVR
jgi:hypothetical protein